jgi:3-methyladenine DNA glycosylase Tag
MSGMNNISLALYTLDELRGLCWRIVLRKREEFRQKELG